MQNIVLFVLLPTVFAILLSGYLNQRVSDLLPASYMFFTIYLYAFSVVDRLQLGIQSIPILIATLLIFHVFYSRTKYLSHKQFRDLLSPAFVIFLLASWWAFFHSQEMRFKEWDEFSYWGAAVKSLYLFDQVSPYAPVKGAFPEYLPGLPLLPYFATNQSAMWQESTVFWAYQVFVFSILASIISTITWKRWILLIYGAISLLLAATLFFKTFQSVYADSILGILFGYSLLHATSSRFLEKKSYRLNFILVITFMSMIKDIGVYFSFVSLFLYSVNLYNLQKSELRAIRKSLKIPLIISLISSALIFLVKYVWELLLSDKLIPTDRSILKIVKNQISGNESIALNSFTQEVSANFLKKLTESPITTINSFPITSIYWITGLVVVIFLVLKNYYFFHKTITSAIILLGFIGYLILLYFSYILVFSESEALGLASFERYIAVYLLGVTIFLTSILIHRLNERRMKLRVPILYFSCLWIVFLYNQPGNFNLKSYINSPNEQSDLLRNGFGGEVWLIREMNFKSSDRVWIVAQHTVGFEFYLLQYEILPGQVGKIPFSIGTAKDSGDIWTDTSYDAKKWNEALNEFDYVYIHNSTNSFVDDFGSLFEDKSTQGKPGVYAVTQNGDQNVLVKIR